MFPHGIRIGRLFGIDLRMDWSWVFIFVLLTWNLLATFAAWHPDWAPAAIFAVAVAASLLFFACILVHELAHSLVAKTQGTHVRSITLFLFGGVSDIEREPKSPGAEFSMAIAGPAASILLGVVFLMFTSGAFGQAMAKGNPREFMSSLGPAATLFAWLGPINITIGLFNLVPAFPLDGGRVLRAFIWAVIGDLRRATRAAAMVGGLIGWMLIAAGIGMSFGVYIPYLGTGFASGLWLAFIGWFIASAATQTGARIALDDALTGMTVAHLMRRDIPTVPPDCPLATVIQDYLVRGSDRAVAVASGDQFLGLVSMATIRRIAPEEWSMTPASDAMIPVQSLATTTPESALTEAFEQVARRDVDQLPVIQGGRLAGMLRRKDITRWLELAWKPGTTTTDATPRIPRGVRPTRRSPGSSGHEPHTRPT